MRHILLFLLVVFSFSGAIAQNSKKGFEYSGTKARFSFLGKSKMFSEGVKPYDFSIYWNKKKNILTVNAGPKEKWYSVAINKVDTIHGNVTHLGILEGLSKGATEEEIKKSQVEIRFMIDKISIKIGESRLEEYLLEGARVWDDKSVSAN